MTTRKTAPKTETAKTEAPKQELVINGVKLTSDTKLKYRANPKRPNSRAWERYEAYQKATTLAEYLDLNDAKYAKADLRHDQMKGFFEIVD